jgi:hypothetical protein
MTTWRAFALNVGRVVPPAIGGVAAGVGLAATAAMGLFCARRLRSGDRLVVGLAWLGLAAAANAFTWHAHVHQSLLLVPPLYWVVGLRPEVRAPVEALCLLSAAGFLAVAFAASLGLAHDLMGMALLAVLVTTTAGCAVAIRRLGGLPAAAG